MNISINIDVLEYLAMSVHGLVKNVYINTLHRSTY